MTTHVLTLTNGTDSVTLTSAPYVMTRYGIVNGRDADETVTETIELAVTGSSVSDMVDNVRDIQKLLSEAADPEGERVYLNVNLISDSSTWRTRVYGGTMTPRDNIMQAYNGLTLEHDLAIVREPTFQGSRTQLQFTPSSGTVTLSNASNAAEFVDPDIVAPAPIELHIEANATSAWDRVIVGVDTVTGFTGTEHISGSGSGSWVGATDHDTTQWSATIGNVDDYDGKKWHIYAPFTSWTTGIELQGHLGITKGGTTYHVQSGQPYECELSTGQVIDFGVFTLPPAGRGTADGGVTFDITAYHSTDGSFLGQGIHVFPALNHRVYRMLPFSLVSGDKIVDDGLEGELYLSSSGTKYASVTASGRPLMVRPNASNRISVLLVKFAGGVPSFSTSTTFDLTAYYRPTRYTI